MGLFALPKLSNKKAKKLRQDKFSKKAKLAGFRARSAFKLIQIENKYHIFSNAKVCIDLCAAPGSWMQVASKYMNRGSVVIGVDRCPIKSIPFTIALQGDITTTQVRDDLREKIRDFQVDVVLHDGAPKVGKSWLHDAYAQNELVLSAFKLACEFLKAGGTFVTKVFRSKDHTSLEYVFKKLFKKVESMKPTSSRFQSAEFFVVCLGYHKPDKLDPSFFNPKYVFLHVENEPKNKIDVMKPEKGKKKAVGYEEGITMLYKKFKLSDFILADNYIEMLQEANEFEWDIPNDRADKKEADIKDIISDIKVLGRSDLKKLLLWRKHKKADVQKFKDEQMGNEKEEDEESAETIKIQALEEAYAKVAALKAKIKYVKESGKRREEKSEENSKPSQESPALDEEFDELEKAQEEINRLKAKLVNEVKNKVKKVSKRKAKLLEKMRLGQLSSTGPLEQDSELFTIGNLDNVDNLDDIVNDGEMDTLAKEIDDSAPPRQVKKKKQVLVQKGVVQDKYGKTYTKDGEDESENESYFSEEEDKAKELSDDKDVDEFLDNLNSNIETKEREFEDKLEESKSLPVIQNPLLLDLVGEAFQEKEERKAEQWFNNPLFEDADNEDDLEYALEVAMKKGEEKLQKDKIQDLKKQFNPEEFDEGSDVSEDEDIDDQTSNDKKRKTRNFQNFDNEDDSNSDTDDDSENEPSSKKRKLHTDTFNENDGEDSSDSSDEEEELSRKEKHRQKRDLRSDEKALALTMVRSAKSKRDITDAAWNRHMRDYTGAPFWYILDENMFNKPQLDVDPKLTEYYSKENTAVDAKTIKKKVEAEARKKRRLQKRLKSYNTKAQAICGRLDITERERAVELKKIASKVTRKKKEKKYVVMKKRMAGRKPKGEKGKMVDKRLKKEKRANLAKEKRKGKKKKR